MVEPREKTDEINNTASYASYIHGVALYWLTRRRSNWYSVLTQRQISENICSEDDLRSGIFGTFVVKFPIYSLKTKIRLTMLYLSGFQLCSRCHERPCFVIMDFILAYASDSAPLS